MGLTTHRVGKKLFIIRKTAGLSELKELSYKPWHALTVPRVFRENVLTFKPILFKASNKSRRVSRRTFISEFHCWRIWSKKKFQDFIGSLKNFSLSVWKRVQIFLSPEILKSRILDSGSLIGNWIFWILDSGLWFRNMNFGSWILVFDQGSWIWILDFNNEFWIIRYFTSLHFLYLPEAASVGLTARAQDARKTTMQMKTRMRFSIGSVLVIECPPNMPITVPEQRFSHV